MRNIQLNEMTYGEFQEQLVRHVMKKIEEEKDTSSLIYFPVVHERVEAFLLAHWQQAWQECNQLTWNEWLLSSCYTIFENEVLDDILAPDHIFDLTEQTEEVKPVENK
ncbi:hypothetical protein K8O68_14920 [Salipaludibacillus sp. CUR1]|uniref:hypothetical protein n=1 Tax=Salipaludibacillus sp. CUR1 TaxID=2820003 RepID=UPI001E3E9966|nr:hypothetical protein [Salipaludibacillus sp. CUR1]MCE7793716.1 hypothetical protein [Salipaludibacillus sp. CUR1]